MLWLVGGGGEEDGGGGEEDGIGCVGKWNIGEVSGEDFSKRVQG